MNNREVSDSDLIIKFPNKEAADFFASWLCNSGEQNYWEYMTYREEEFPNEKNITAISFHYHGEEDKTKSTTDPLRYGKFMDDGIIRTTIGNLNKL